MSFTVFGQVDAYLDGRRLDLGHARQRHVLAALLLEAARPVSTDRLIDRVWGPRAPRQARGTLYGYLSRLRQALAPAEDVQLERLPDGYVLTVEDQSVDVHRFRRLAGQAAAASDDEQALASIEDALALWRGEALAGLDTPWTNAVRETLEKERLAAELLQADIALRLGRHDDLIPLLTTRAAARPLDERLIGQLMLALYRSGNQVEALRHYERTRLRLAQEYGMDPGPDLQRLHHRILNTDASLTCTVAASADRSPHQTPAPSPEAAPADTHASVPRQLPAPPSLFTGRLHELAQLDKAIDSRSAPITVLSGAAGMGKTALAVHWAHRVDERFPDGQLFVDLRGYAMEAPLRPVEALTQLLHGLGFSSEQIPPVTESAGALYRSAIAGKRLLVILDNARDADQVRQLLPGSATSVTVVTSRERLPGLIAREGARGIVLGVLAEEESIDLLTAIAGTDRTSEEPAATAELARLCAHTPLALRIAATNLLDDPYQSMSGYVGELRRGNALASLEVPGDPQTAVSAAFDLTYARLDPAVRRAFRLLGVAPAAEFSVPAAGAVVAADGDATRKLLARLVNAHLLNRCGPDRFAFHDLLRLHARWRAEQDDGEEDLTEASGRLLDWYLRRADETWRLAYPHLLRLPDNRPESVNRPAEFADHTAALAWCAEERQNLVAAVRYAAGTGHREMSWRLADAIRGYLYAGWHTADLLTIGETALSAAESAGHAAARAAMHFCVANAHYCAALYDLAIEHTAAGVALAREAGWQSAVASGLGNLGAMEFGNGRLDEAVAYYTEAAEIKRGLGDLASLAVTLGNLGGACGNLGRLDEAAKHLEAAVEISRATEAHNSEGINLCNLANAYQLMARYTDAIECLQSSITLSQQFGEREIEILALHKLGETYRDLGRYEDCLAAAESARALAVEADYVRGEAVANSPLASVRLRTNPHAEALIRRLLPGPAIESPHPETKGSTPEDSISGREHQEWRKVLGEAADLQEEAARLMAETYDKPGEIMVLFDLADTYVLAGEAERARNVAVKARESAAGGGLRLFEARSLTALATAELALGRPAQAADLALSALPTHISTGDRRGHADALSVLSKAHLALGDISEARTALQAARAVYAEIGYLASAAVAPEPEADDL
ncbi:AfsR/SARP family transcriptional regulator [Nonomuraea jiangxiensis]|uniref:AfsR/SARP family transcriptional regulator n=1 Tax=Nonomuraea jiangxiensis TaxID=633440 RepID=UPI0015A0B30B|nr:AfsR/SARP family transcriptional regulator [Nonomuraea jiangxiensis]